MTIFAIILAVLICIGILFIELDLLDIPYIKSSKVIYNLHQKNKTYDSIKTSIIKMAKIIAPYIPINEYREILLQQRLTTIDCKSTPKEFIAENIITSAIYFLLGILFIFFVKPIGFAFIIFSILSFFWAYTRIDAKIKKKRESIEKELHRFSAHIGKCLANERNVPKALSSYMNYAGKELKSELSLTLADINTGNTENAIRRMDARIKSTMFSDIARGLISALHGNDTTIYWQTLTLKFNEMLKEKLRKKAHEIPDKFQNCSAITAFSFIGLIMIILITSAISDGQILFK